MNQKVNEELKREIIDFYKTKPMSFHNIQVKYGLSLPTIGKILINEKKYPKYLIYNPDFCENYFQNIDNEFKAYFIGLMIADGNVFESNDGYERQSSISITLDNKDKYILEEFKKSLRINTKISDDGRGCSQIAVRSTQMAKDLSQYGIIPRKTLTTFLPIIDDEYMPHLIRGILDGDGCIGAHYIKSGRFLHFISFCGTHELMDGISEYLVKKLNLKTKPKVYDYKNRELSEISIRNIDDMVLVGDFLYENANIFLKRKKEKYDNFLSYYELK